MGGIGKAIGGIAKGAGGLAKATPKTGTKIDTKNMHTNPMVGPT